jgi:hypothetical protein
LKQHEILIMEFQTWKSKEIERTESSSSKEKNSTISRRWDTGRLSSSIWFKPNAWWVLPQKVTMKPILISLFITNFLSLTQNIWYLRLSIRTNSLLVIWRIYILNIRFFWKFNQIAKFPHIANYLKPTDFLSFLFFLRRTAKLPNCASIVLSKFVWEVLIGCHISKFWISRTSSYPTWLREPKFQHSRFYGLSCKRGTNFGFSGAWQTEFFFRSYYVF